MEKLIYYKRYPERALEGMADLTHEERGVYNTIIDMLYAREGDLNDDNETMPKRCGCHWRTYKAIKKSLIEKGKIWVYSVVVDGQERFKIMARGVQDTLKNASRLSEEQSRRVSKRWQDQKNTNENNDPPIRAGNTNIVRDIDIVEGESGGGASSPTPAKVIQIKKEAARRTRLPPDWEPDEAGIAYARRHGVSPDRIPLEVEKFRDYHISRGNLMLEWWRAWQTWCRNANRFGGPKPKSTDWRDQV